MSIEYTPGPLLDAARHTPTALWNDSSDLTDSETEWQVVHELALEATYRGFLDISVGRVPVDNPDEVPVALNYQATHSPPIPRSVSPSSAWSTTQSKGRLTQRDPLD